MVTGPALQIGEVFDGRYTIVRQLGEGGMATVYEAVDNNTRRHRALKVMRGEVVDKPEMYGRFRREAVIASAIESEHVAETIDAGVSQGGAPYIVLELLKGQELAAMVEQRGALPADETMLYLSQAAMALEKAHAVDVVHRDLKPENMFVTYRDDGTPRVKLLDFGIAKLIAGTLTGPETKGMIGTPLYMTPEQIHGERDISPQTDLFALAHTAYTLLTGEPYWRPEKEGSKTPYQFLVKMMQGLPEEPTVRAAARRGVQLPPAFNPWFRTATAAEPRDRFGGALEMIDGLADVLGTSVA